MRFATGKNALGMCDRCGLQYPLHRLVPDGDNPGLLVHPSCRDIKDPTKKPVRLEEGIALKNPRPDRDDDTVGDIADITGTATAGTADTITLDDDASDLQGAYVNCTIELTGGTGSGQTRTIQGYDGPARRAHVAAWDTTPDETTTYSITVPLLAGRLGFDTYFGGAT